MTLTQIIGYEQALTVLQHLFLPKCILHYKSGASGCARTEVGDERWSRREAELPAVRDRRKQVLPQRLDCLICQLHSWSNKKIPP